MDCGERQTVNLVHCCIKAEFVVVYNLAVSILYDITNFHYLRKVY